MDQSYSDTMLIVPDVERRYRRVVAVGFINVAGYLVREMFRLPYLFGNQVRRSSSIFPLSQK